MLRTNYKSVFILLIFLFLSYKVYSQNPKKTKHKFTFEGNESWKIANNGFYQEAIKYTSDNISCAPDIDNYKSGFFYKQPRVNFTRINTPDKLQKEKTKSDTSASKSNLDKISYFIEWYMKYLPVPYLSYSNETNWLFGVSKYNAFRFNRGDLDDIITQASSINSYAYYTLNNQIKIALEANLMFNKNISIWQTNIYYTDYPLDFYGVGNKTKLSNRRTLLTSDWQFSTYYLHRVFNKWYFGLAYDYFNYFDVELAEGFPELQSDSINLANNIGPQSGIGLKLQMEGRDNRLNAKSGFYLDASFQVFRKALGSEYEYDYFQADLRYYITPLRRLTIAAQLRTQSKSGDVPVQSLAFLGGDYNMRGTYRGRYRDHVLIDSQVELRFPIYWIFGGVIFNSIGQVAPEYQDMAFERFHYNYGAGLRVNVDSKNDINLRFDYGISSDQSFFIINFAEAF